MNYSEREYDNVAWAVIVTNKHDQPIAGYGVFDTLTDAVEYASTIPSVDGNSATAVAFYTLSNDSIERAK